jgi:hypothetical protein
MQISRHWRLNAIRYRLEGFQTFNEQKTLMARPLPVAMVENDPKQAQSDKVRVAPVATAA